MYPRVFPAILWAALAHAQTFGDISGEVKDASGAIIPKAKVTVTNQRTNTSRETLTNEQGLYRFPSLVPSIYSVRVEANGFRSAVRSDIELQVQQSASIDFTLSIGQGPRCIGHRRPAEHAGRDGRNRN